MAIRCCLLHSIPGRVRIRVESALIFDKLRDPFEAFLRKQPGIRDVSMNSTCRSLVLTFDPAIRTPADLLHLLETLPLDQFKASAMGACQTSRTKDQDSNFWIPLGLSTAAVALGLFESVLAPWLLAGAAIPIFRRTYDTLMEKGKLNVDVLDAAATTVLTLQGQIQTATTMVWLVSLGECIRDITMQQSRRAIEGLFDRQADSAWIVRQGRKVQVNVGDIKEGDEVVVYPGELIPVDGTVLRGKATVDQKVLTGESLPVEKAAADAVFATTVVRDGKLYVEAAKVGSETAAANIIRLVRDAPIRETRVQNYAEEFGDRLVPWSFLGAGASYLATSNLNTAASLLIVDYGTGIRVAAPTTVLSSMTKAARQGIFIKGGRHLERLTEIDTIIFDKTGTLTTGSPEVVKVLPFGKQVTTEQVLAFAAAAEERLTHPVAEAIVRAARSHGIAVPERKDSRYTIGLGVEASVDGSVTLVGCQRFMIMKGIADSRKINRFLKMNGRPVSPVFAAVDGQLIGLIEYTDPLRPEAPAVIRALQERGLKEIVMLTGDHPIMAKKVAERVGISRYIADALPEQKLEFVRDLQRQGRTVAVVGDGINDSPALAQADVGIAVRGGADVATETADVALLEGNLWKIPQAIDVARESMQLIRQNWDLVFYPNTAAIGLSLLGLIGPVGATLISNGSAIAATFNALRPLLHGSQPTGIKPTKAERLCEAQLSGVFN